MTVTESRLAVSGCAQGARFGNIDRMGCWPIPLIPLTRESRHVLVGDAGLARPSHRYARTCSGHPRVFQGLGGSLREMPGTSPGMTGEWPGWRDRMDARIPEQVRASPAIRAQGARCGNIGRALGSFSNRMLARGIPLIPLNPGESPISVSRNPVSVSGWASRPAIPSRRARMPGTALRPGMEMAGYPDTRNESGQVRAGR